MRRLTIAWLYESLKAEIKWNVQYVKLLLKSLVQFAGDYCTVQYCTVLGTFFPTGRVHVPVWARFEHLAALLGAKLKLLQIPVR